MGCSCKPAGCSLLINYLHGAAALWLLLAWAWHKSLCTLLLEKWSLFAYCGVAWVWGTSQRESVQLAWQNVMGCSRSPAGSPLPPEKCEISIGHLKSSKVQTALFYVPSPWWTGVVLCGLYLRHSKTERILCWTEARSIYVRERVCVCMRVCTNVPCLNLEKMCQHFILMYLKKKFFILNIFQLLLVK